MLVTVAGASLAVGSAIASPTPSTSTTDVKFVSLAQPFKLFTGKSFSANLRFSATVIGGSTKVPTNATTVQLRVEAGGKSAGFMNFYPAGNLSGGSGQFLSWSAGGSQTQTIEENIGTADQLTFANGNTAATATASILGYSTQVTAGDINGTGGTGGQVLTNDGAGGASWQTAGQAYGAGTNDLGHGTPVPTTGVLIDSQSVPAGKYVVSWTGVTYLVSGNPGAIELIDCSMLSPDGIRAAVTQTTLPLSDNQRAVSMQALMDTTGGTIDVYCTKQSASTTVVILLDHLVVVQVSGVSGLFTN
jgi:hypothetical protein